MTTTTTTARPGKRAQPAEAQRHPTFNCPDVATVSGKITVRPPKNAAKVFKFRHLQDAAPVTATGGNFSTKKTCLRGDSTASTGGSGGEAKGRPFKALPCKPRKDQDDTGDPRASSPPFADLFGLVFPAQIAGFAEDQSLIAELTLPVVSKTELCREVIVASNPVHPANTTSTATSSSSSFSMSVNQIWGSLFEDLSELDGPVGMEPMEMPSEFGTSPEYAGPCGNPYEVEGKDVPETEGATPSSDAPLTSVKDDEEMELINSVLDPEGSGCLAGGYFDGDDSLPGAGCEDLLRFVTDSAIGMDDAGSFLEELSALGLVEGAAEEAEVKTEVAGERVCRVAPFRSLPQEDTVLPVEDALPSNWQLLDDDDEVGMIVEEATEDPGNVVNEPVVAAPSRKRKLVHLARAAGESLQEHSALIVGKEYSVVGEKTKAIRYRRIRDLNNAASRRCREKRKQKLQDLEQEEKVLSQINAELHLRAEELAERVAKMKQVLMEAATKSGTRNEVKDGGGSPGGDANLTRASVTDFDLDLLVAHSLNDL